jgi:diphthamide synthase (EF-2-diphthine--ammonia ligase)
MRVALLWNGFGDPGPACDEAKEFSNVKYLLTFIPEKAKLPLEDIKQYSEKIGIPFCWVRVNQPYPEACRQALVGLKEDEGIEGIVVSCFSSTDYFKGNWIDSVCGESGLKVFNLGWKMNLLRAVDQQHRQQNL